MSRFVLLLSVCFLLAGCATYTKVQPVFVQDDKVQGTVSPSLRTFVKSTASPKVVLRVPSVVSSIVQEQSDAATNDSFYAAFEEKLLSEGFRVRDRALLQEVLRTGSTDYSDLGRKVDTDLIIEITKVSFQRINNSTKYEDLLISRTFVNEGVSGQIPLKEIPARSLIAEFEARIILVRTGDVAGIIKLKTHLCEYENCLVELDRRLGGLTYYYPNHMASAVAWPVSARKKASDYFAGALIHRLRGDL